MRFQKQRIARTQYDIADLHVDPLTITGNGNYGGIVMCSELCIANGNPDERTARGHDGFDQTTS